MKKLLLLTVAVVMFGATATRAEAQEKNTTINLQIPELLFIDVTSDVLTIPSPTLADYDAAFTGSTTHGVIHRGNVDHVITVAPATGVTTWDGPATSSKDPADLQWSTDGSSWNAVTASADVGTGVKGGFGLNPNIPVSWRSVIAYDEPVGDYSIVVTYTSTAN